MLKILWRDLHQSYFVVALSAGVVAGTILGLVFRINYFASAWWCGAAFLMLVFAYLKPKFVFMVVALIAGMILAFFRIATELKGRDYIRGFYGQTVVVSGAIEGDPETDDGGTKFKLGNLSFGENGEWESAGSLYVTGYKNQELARGDTVVLSGKMGEGFGTYVGYLWRPTVVAHRRPEPGNLVLRVRNWFAGRIEKLIPEPEVNLGLSYLLGMKSGLPDELDEALRVVGLIHIVVASGAHLSILVEVAKKIFGRISRFAGLMFSVLFVIFFMAMVGWTPSILRAGIMSILTLLAWYVGRKVAAWRMILMVAAGTLMVNPNFILNLGWLLSFASFAGIMIMGPKIQEFFYGEKKPGFVSGVVLTTLSATIMTLPIVLYYYGQVSLISVIANLLILPTLAWAMGLVFMTGVVAGVPGIGIAISWLATRLLDFHIAVVEFFGSMEQFLVKMEPYRAEVFLIYAFIVVVFLWKKIRNMLKWKHE